MAAAVYSSFQGCLQCGRKETEKKSTFFLRKVRYHFCSPSKGVLAQLVERLNGIEEVRGSNPLGSRLRPVARSSWRLHRAGQTPPSRLKLPEASSGKPNLPKPLADLASFSGRLGLCREAATQNSPGLKPGLNPGSGGGQRCPESTSNPASAGCNSEKAHRYNSGANTYQQTLEDEDDDEYENDVPHEHPMLR